MLTWIKESSPIQQLKQMPILKMGKNMTMWMLAWGVRVI